MRILHITDGIPPAVLGGSGRIVTEIARQQRMKGHDVSILAPHIDTPATNEDGVRLIPLSAKDGRWAHYRSVFSLQRAEEILRVIDDVKPDVIHAHSIAWQCGYRWIPFAAKRGIKIIVTCHDVMNIACGRILPSDKRIWLTDLRRSRWTWNPLRTRIIRSILTEHCTVLTVSDALRIKMEECGYKSLRTLHNGIDTTYWTASPKAEARQKLNLPADVPTFLLAGRLGVDKGVDLVLKTLPKSARLVIATDRGAELFASIGDRVTVFEHQSPDQMRLLYSACDAVLVPSRCLDCFPTVCLEAMSCSRPVLATSWGGAKESVRDGVDGWIMDPYNMQAWWERMQWCADNKTQLFMIGETARKHTAETFGLPHMVESLMKYYESSHEKLHIVLLAPAIGGKSGWSRYATDIATSLQKSGHTVTALVHEKNIAHSVTQFAVLPRDVNSMHPLIALFYGWKLRRTLYALQPDVIHIMAEPYALMIPCMGKSSSIVTTLHGTYAIAPFNRSWATRTLFRIGLKMSDSIISVSNFTKQHVQKMQPDVFKEDHFEEKIVVIPNGLDLSEIPPPASHVENQAKQIISVGALKPRKGYLQSINAIARFNEKYKTPFHYHLVGSLSQDPAYVEEVKKKIEEYGLQHVVTIHGGIDHDALQKLYSSADLYLMPSLGDDVNFEGFGLVFLEASAYGVPVIGPTTGGCPEAIEEGKSGYVCDPYNAELIAETMDSILNRNTIRRETCRAWAEQNTIEKRMEMLLEVYRRLR